MENLKVLQTIKENLEYNLDLFNKVGNLGMYKDATLIESKSDVIRSIRKVDTLIKQLEVKDGV